MIYILNKSYPDRKVNSTSKKIIMYTSIYYIAYMFETITMFSEALPETVSKITSSVIKKVPNILTNVTSISDDKKRCILKDISNFILVFETIILITRFGFLLLSCIRKVKDKQTQNIDENEDEVKVEEKVKEKEIKRLIISKEKVKVKEIKDILNERYTLLGSKVSKIRKIINE